MSAPDNPVVLIVLDGWGYSSVYEGNAIAQASLPTFNTLWKEQPHTLLQAAGESVGLPWGEMGNSEVGHLNIGAGRVVAQDLPRISKAIASEQFFANDVLLAACQHVNTTGGALHLVGLASNGGIHSHIRHLFALLKLAKQKSVQRVYIHAFTDGRDAPTKAAKQQLAKLEEELATLRIGKIASVGGRYYAMDRNQKWDRTNLAYQAIVNGEGPQAASVQEAIEGAYAEGLSDEFILPTVIVEDGQPVGAWQEQDAAIFFNFRPDRSRQLTAAIVSSGFSEFERGHAVTGMHFVTMTEFERHLPVRVAFPPENVPDTLAKVLADHGVRQFHIAETEKYAHATFFFNGGIEDPNPLEERLLVPSPKVPTYDQQPEMSAHEITTELAKRIGSGDYPFIMVNYANPDMVGHSGSIMATVQAVETVDTCLQQVLDAAAKANTYVILTADHGNAEEMVNFTTGEVDTEHTTNPVPFIVVPPPHPVREVNLLTGRLSTDARVEPTGLLGDVAPTVLGILGIEPPEGMAGYGLLEGAT